MSWMMSRIPRPPSDWYLRVGGTERAWQTSSCGQAQQAVVTCPAAVEAFNDKGAAVTNIGNLCARCRHTEARAV